MTQARPARNAGIDALRGVSILLVVIHHTCLRIPLQKTALADVLPRRLLSALGYNGYEAVFVFFVISGFLIADNALRRWSSLSRIDKRAFYLRRFARIVPCLLLLLVVLAAFHVLRVPDFVIDRPGQSLGRALFSALALHLNWYEGRTGYLPANWDVLWSLSIEEVFYIGFPVLCLLARRGIAWLAVPLVLLALSLPVTRGMLAANEIWQEKAYLPGMAAIAAGVLAALWSAGAVTPRPRLRAALGWLGAACLAVIFIVEDKAWQVLGEATMLILTGGTAALVIAFAAGWGEARITAWTVWLRACGRRSYEIYLTHMFAVLPAVRLFHASGAGLRGGWMWYPPVLALSFALGWLLDATFSAPADRWLLFRVKLDVAPGRQARRSRKDLL